MYGVGLYSMPTRHYRVFTIEWNLQPNSGDHPQFTNRKSHRLKQCTIKQIHQNHILNRVKFDFLNFLTGSKVCRLGRGFCKSRGDCWLEELNALRPCGDRFIKTIYNVEHYQGPLIQDLYPSLTSVSFFKKGAVRLPTTAKRAPSSCGIADYRLLFCFLARFTCYESSLRLWVYWYSV